MLIRKIGFCMVVALLCGGMQCTPDPKPDPVPPAATWATAFDTTNAGSLSSVWGSGPQDVFVAGGGPDGKVFHYDGTTWTPMSTPAVPLLVWVHGFSSSDVFAVGVGGGAIHYNGTTWTTLDTGVTDDLWGVFGFTPNDLWVVGGSVIQGDPVLLHYDGTAFSRVSVPAAINPVHATALFKVWGVGGKVFAVGQGGLILEYASGSWSHVSAGAQANADFVSLWGTGPSNIVAVGGRGNARIARHDGNTWTTMAPVGVGGINGVFMGSGSEALMVGVNGWAGTYNPSSQALAQEATGTSFDLHAVWEDGHGKAYAVGGNFLAPHRGVALVRTQP